MYLWSLQKEVMLDGFVVSTSQFIYNKLLHEAEEELDIYDCKWLLKMEVYYFHKAWTCSLGDYCQLLVCALSSYLVATNNWKLITLLAQFINNKYIMLIFYINDLKLKLLRVCIDWKKRRSLFPYCGSWYQRNKMLNFKLCPRVLNGFFYCSLVSNFLSFLGSGRKRTSNFFSPHVIKNSSSQALVFHSSISTSHRSHHEMWTCLQREYVLKLTQLHRRGQAFV